MTNVITTPTTATTPVPFYSNPTLGLFGITFAPVKATVVGADVLMNLAKGAIHGQSVNPMDLINLGLGGITGYYQTQYVSRDGTIEFNLHVDFGGLTIGTQAGVNIHHSQGATNLGTLDDWRIDTFFETGLNEYAGVSWHTQGSDSGLPLSRTESIDHMWQNGNVGYSDSYANGVLMYQSIGMQNPLLTLVGQTDNMPLVPQLH